MEFYGTRHHPFGRFSEKEIDQSARDGTAGALRDLMAEDHSGAHKQAKAWGLTPEEMDKIHLFLRFESLIPWDSKVAKSSIGIASADAVINMRFMRDFYARG